MPRKALERALQRATRPLVDANARLYAWVNQHSARSLQGARASAILRRGVSADGITTARTALVLPTLGLLSHGHTLAPAALVVVNVTFDYVDGAVARWEQERRRKEAPHVDLSKVATLPTARAERLRETWGAYYDAIADKAFAIPVWVSAIVLFPDSPLLQAGLGAHVAVETYSSYVRTRAYFCEPAGPSWLDRAAPAPAPVGVKGSSVVAGIVGKTKQFVAMLGTAMVLVPATHTLGSVLVCASVPLAVASVLQKSREVAVYTELTAAPGLTATSLALLERSRAQGSRLIVGVREDDGGQPPAALQEALRLHPSVDAVVVALPPLKDVARSAFLDAHGIDLVVLPPAEARAARAEADDPQSVFVDLDGPEVTSQRS